MWQEPRALALGLGDGVEERALADDI